MEVLRAIFHDGPLGLQANYAREQDTFLASLASRGCVTSLDIEGKPTRQWRLTQVGTLALRLEEV